MKIKALLMAGVLFTASVTMMQGCQTTASQRGAMGGAAVGAVAGQLIGGNTKSTLIGAGAGALGGALLNDHVDNQRRQSYEQGYNDAQRTPPPPQYNTAPRN